MVRAFFSFLPSFLPSFLEENFLEKGGNNKKIAWVRTGSDRTGSDQTGSGRTGSDRTGSDRVDSKHRHAFNKQKSSGNNS